MEVAIFIWTVPWCESHSQFVQPSPTPIPKLFHHPKQKLPTQQKFPISSSPAPGNLQFTFCLSGFAWRRQCMSVKSYSTAQNAFKVGPIVARI